MAVEGLSCMFLVLMLEALSREIERGHMRGFESGGDGC